MVTPIELDKPRHLRFTIQDCIDMESVLGLSLGEVVHRLRTVSMTATRAALWAGLKHEDPELTLVSVGDILEAYCASGGKMMTVTKAFDDALSNSTPLQSSGTSGNARPKAK